MTPERSELFYRSIRHFIFQRFHKAVVTDLFVRDDFVFAAAGAFSVMGFYHKKDPPCISVGSIPIWESGRVKVLCTAIIRNVRVSVAAVTAIIHTVKTVDSAVC